MPISFSIVLLGFGFVAIFFPGLLFFLSEGWKFRDAEPSDFYLITTRIGGVVAIVFGLITLILPSNGSGHKPPSGTHASTNK